jgi:NitT/TauT family transport system ATP-binding protein
LGTIQDSPFNISNFVGAKMKNNEIVLEVDGISHWFGDNLVLNDVNLKVPAGQILSLVGPSGCGKSTLLKAVLGTHPANDGTIKVAGEFHRSPTRNVGIVYQHYHLPPFLTVRQNVALGLKLDQTSLPYRFFCYPKWKKLEKDHLEQATAFLETVNLKDKGDLFPHELSGGMRQRVAIAQSMIMKPDVLLLDEPFGALDEETRERLQELLLGFYQDNETAVEKGKKPPNTIVIVTHELTEALIVADRVVGLSQFHSDGHRGASVVLDEPAPIFAPGFEREMMQFNEQKDRLRHAVFNPEVTQHRDDFQSYWQDHQRKIQPVEA